jgi:hypothetical protein
MLLKYYKKYKAEGLVHPKLVTEQTDNYRRKCDIYQDFLDDTLIKTGDIQHKMAIPDLYVSMRTWYRSNHEGRCPNVKELRNYLTHRVSSYNPKIDILCGYRLKTDTDGVMGDLDGNAEI